MTTPNEELNTGTQNNGDENKGHPAWQPILDVLPEEFHPLVRSELEKMDQGVTHKLQEVHSQYDPYKSIIETGLTAEEIENALKFGAAFDQDPEAIIKQAIEHYGLTGFTSGQGSEGEGEQEPSSKDLKDLAEQYPDDPRIQELLSRQEEFENRLGSREQAEAEAEAEAALDEYLDALADEYGAYDEQIVLAYMAVGIDGETAVQQFRQMYPNWEPPAEEGADANDQASGNEPPVVVGGVGTTGSGLPNPGSNLGEMKNNQVSDLVTQILEKANKE